MFLDKKTLKKFKILYKNMSNSVKPFKPLSIRISNHEQTDCSKKEKRTSDDRALNELFNNISLLVKDFLEKLNPVPISTIANTPWQNSDYPNSIDTFKARKVYESNQNLFIYFHSNNDNNDILNGWRSEVALTVDKTRKFRHFVQKYGTFSNFTRLIYKRVLNVNNVEVTDDSQLVKSHYLGKITKNNEESLKLMAHSDLPNAQGGESSKTAIENMLHNNEMEDSNALSENGINFQKPYDDLKLQSNCDNSSRPTENLTEIANIDHEVLSNIDFTKPTECVQDKINNIQVEIAISSNVRKCIEVVESNDNIDNSEINTEIAVNLSEKTQEKVNVGDSYDKRLPKTHEDIKEFMEYSEFPSVIELPKTINNGYILDGNYKSNLIEVVKQPSVITKPEIVIEGINTNNCISLRQLDQDVLTESKEICTEILQNIILVALEEAEEIKSIDKSAVLSFGDLPPTSEERNDQIDNNDSKPNYVIEHTNTLFDLAIPTADKKGKVDSKDKSTLAEATLDIQTAKGINLENNNNLPEDPVNFIETSNSNKFFNMKAENINYLHETQMKENVLSANLSNTLEDVKEKLIIGNSESFKCGDFPDKADNIKHQNNSLEFTELPENIIKSNICSLNPTHFNINHSHENSKFISSSKLLEKTDGFIKGTDTLNCHDSSRKPENDKINMDTKIVDIKTCEINISLDNSELIKPSNLLLETDGLINGMDIVKFEFSPRAAKDEKIDEDTTTIVDLSTCADVIESIVSRTIEHTQKELAEPIVLVNSESEDVKENSPPGIRDYSTEALDSESNTIKEDDHPIDNSLEHFKPLLKELKVVIIIDKKIELLAKSLKKDAYNDSVVNINNDRKRLPSSDLIEEMVAKKLKCVDYNNHEDIRPCSVVLSPLKMTTILLEQIQSFKSELYKNHCKSSEYLCDQLVVDSSENIFAPASKKIKLTKSSEEIIVNNSNVVTKSTVLNDKVMVVQEAINQVTPVPIKDNSTLKLNAHANNIGQTKISDCNKSITALNNVKESITVKKLLTSSIFAVDQNKLKIEKNDQPLTTIQNNVPDAKNLRKSDLSSKSKNLTVPKITVKKLNKQTLSASVKDQSKPELNVPEKHVPPSSYRSIHNQIPEPKSNSVLLPKVDDMAKIKITVKETNNQDSAKSVSVQQVLPNVNRNANNIKRKSPDIKKPNIKAFVKTNEIVKGSPPCVTDTSEPVKKAFLEKYTIPKKVENQIASEKKEIVPPINKETCSFNLGVKNNTQKSSESKLITSSQNSKNKEHPKNNETSSEKLAVSSTSSNKLMPPLILEKRDISPHTNNKEMLLLSNSKANVVVHSTAVSTNKIANSSNNEAVGKWGNPNDGYDFVSHDAAENADNFHADWNKVRNVRNVCERYRAIRELWRNLAIPDPSRNLTFRHCRGNATPTLRRQVITNRRQRSLSCSSIYEAMIERASLNARTSFLELEETHQQDMNKMAMYYRQLAYQQLPGMLIEEHNRDLQSLQRIYSEHKWTIQNNLQNELRVYQDYVNEIRTFHSFYQGLDENDNANKMTLTAEQVDVIDDAAKTYDAYTEIYRPKKR